MNVKALLLAILLPTALLAQGFAGLGTEVTGFAQPQRGTPLTFPQDHGSHPAYRIEWWYLTANLTGPDGTPYGAQWTLFRSATAPHDGKDDTPFDPGTLWLAHAAVTSQSQHYVAERFARAGTGAAGVNAAPFEAWIDEWHMTGQPEQGLSQIKITAQGTDFAYDLNLSAEGPLVLQGDKGYSVKSASGQASYYYSQPFYRVTGSLILPDGTVPVTGQAWLDREWSSQPLEGDQTGWDWVSLHLDSGAKLMGFRLRDSGAGYTSATWIEPNGTATAYPDGALTLTPQATSPVKGREVPTQWLVDFPARDLRTTITALTPRAWMDTSVPYWEGPVTVTGTHSGVGYLEMTGY